MATISCTARPKKETSGRLMEAAWVADNETSSEEIARFVQDIYLARYGAHIAQPRGPFLALRDATGQVRAALALRRGETPFFLEHYLDAPVQTLLPGGVREGIVEVGSPSGGAGLGLAIVQRIVAFHGGRVGAEEGADGRGTTMRVVLPHLDMPPPESLPAMSVFSQGY
ncbi:thermostable hemolysin [Tepidiphilus baoligensis]|uniref:histidine kinase n=1 Tax=Tepidiphilus baoligensis TaxID=2698687 RepID=A0ABX1QK68_9PROT|nr:thermostable hemolysin [Tepidiphilus baoligensis]NMH16092.1 hypothetical protein [Tepidiphilus baoligensis]